MSDLQNLTNQCADLAERVRTAAIRPLLPYGTFEEAPVELQDQARTLMRAVRKLSAAGLLVHEASKDPVPS